MAPLVVVRKGDRFFCPNVVSVDAEKETLTLIAGPAEEVSEVAKSSQNHVDRWPQSANRPDG